MILAALDNKNPVMPLGKVMAAAENHPFDGTVVAAIGSERGWTDRERAFLVEKGFTLCSMGNRILRTESATTVAGSIILSKLGII